MPSISEKQRRFFWLVKAVQRGKLSPKRVGSKVTKAAKEMSPKDVDDFTHGKNLPKKKLEEIIKVLKELIIPNKDIDMRGGFTNSNSGLSPMEPMNLEGKDDQNSDKNPIAKTFQQKGNFEQYIQRFSGLELKPKEIESVTNYTKTNPSKLERFFIRYETTDEFENSKITVIKKLREGNDLVFTAFQVSTPQTTDELPEKPNPSEDDIIVNKTTPFKNEIDGGKILADLLQKLNI